MERKYKFKYSAVFFVLFALIYALALTALIWNGIRLYGALSEKIELGVFKAISLGLSLFLPVVFIVIVTSAIINSAYTLSEKTLVINYGLLKDGFEIKDIASIVKNVRYNSLFVSFKDGSAYKISIDERQFDDFSTSLMKLNPSINYGETDEEKKK